MRIAIVLKWFVNGSRKIILKYRIGKYYDYLEDIVIFNEWNTPI